MNDRHDELVRRAAELKAESAALKVVAKSWPAGRRRAVRPEPGLLPLLQCLAPQPSGLGLRGPCLGLRGPCLGPQSDIELPLQDLVDRRAGDGRPGHHAQLTQHADDGTLGVDGPIREYYLIGQRDTADTSQWRTEIGWPIFRTASP